MGNEVSAQRVTFDSHPPRTPYKQCQQEVSLNTDTSSTNERKSEEFEEDPSRQNINKRRKLKYDECLSRSVLAPRSLIVILKCDSLSSLQSVSQQKDPMRIKKDSDSSSKESDADAVLKEFIQRRIDHVNKYKQEEIRLRRQYERAMSRFPGRDPIGTPSFVYPHATISATPSMSSKLTATGTNKEAETEESPRIVMEFTMETSPNTTASTSSAAVKTKDKTKDD
ncbi:uncharacterized protein EAF01_011567 [Botrytis porri]|uniref:uncharacterized protein n=1 Tax=Botrytis porri TaxID=87229 RepID=UPI0018FF38C6|nr:uncharacterized protein EAF01_011567 [Botrytis porri]KAF7884144.1 hypothetical protein EAF01_011567 [Botrytis porri]